MLEPILADCLLYNIPIVGNFGAANPEGAACLIAKIAKAQGFPSIKIAIVKGDEISASVFIAYLDKQGQEALSNSSLVSANVYLGAREIADALNAGAQVVVTGRVADPALTVGPLMAYFKKSCHDGWTPP